MADARLMNLPVPFEFEGRLWRVTPEPDFHTEALYQTWLEREAYLAVSRHKGLLGPDDYAGRLDCWSRDLAAKEYAWGGDVCYRSLRSEAGWKEMAWLLLKHAEANGGQPGEVTRELVERVAGDPQKAGEMLRIVWGVKDPNPRGPAGQPPPASPPAAA